MENQVIKSKNIAPTKRYNESVKKEVVQEYEHVFFNKDEI
jgi:hypothetical protein